MDAAVSMEVPAAIAMDAVPSQNVTVPPITLPAGDAPRMAAAASLAAAVARVKSFSSEVARATGRQTSSSSPSARMQTFRPSTADDSFDADEAAVFELLEQMVASDPWGAQVELDGGSPEPDELPDSARADLASDIGRVALESILRNVTFVVSTRVVGSFNNVRPAPPS